MSGRFYDVIVLGRGIGSLVAAALLARRDFSVLVMGQGARPATYAYRKFALRRRSFSLLGASSPALRRVLVELAQSQTFRRRAVDLDPMMSLVFPDRRFELPPDKLLLAAEIEREFPEVRGAVDELYGNLTRVNEAADLAFSHDVVVPPGSFWERRKAKKVFQQLPYIQTPGADPLVDFPEGHLYRKVVMETARFATDSARPLPAFALARLHGSWTRGVASMGGGDDELVQFLVDRILAHGGNVALEERAERVLVQRDGVAGVIIDGDITRTGCRYLLSDCTGGEMAELAGGEGIHSKAQKSWPRVAAATRRFAVSLVVTRSGIPDAMGAETFVFPEQSARLDDDHLPVIHLQNVLKAFENPPPGPHGLLVAEVLLPVGARIALTETRERILARLKEFLPWLERHLVVVDSPHDGLPLWDYQSGSRHLVERMYIRQSSVHPEPMIPQYDIPPGPFHGLVGEPVRGPIPRTFLVGKTVMPTLGQEGELLAAWAACHLVTKADPKRQKLRMEMWKRVEIG